MKLPLVVIYEKDRRLAQGLAARAAQERWLLREGRRPDAIARLLLERGPGVLVVAVGADIEPEQELIVRVREMSPVTGIIAVLARESPPLAGRTWDQGASMVFFAPAPPQLLGDTVDALLTTVAG